jgi:hypothetical protein
MADLIYNNNNIFIIQINRRNIVLITQNNDENQVKLFKEGKFMFEYLDIKQNEIKFVRNLNNEIFTFRNNKLISRKIDYDLTPSKLLSL